MGEISVIGQTTTMTEVMGMITGFVGVWLTLKRNIWCFPVGILNVAIYAWLFFTPGIRLYADGMLQCAYIILLIYGWINWEKMKNSRETTIRITSYFFWRVVFLAIPAFIALAFFLQNYTDASLPWLDSGLTIISLVAQWMIAKRFLENWILWILVNIVYIPLYFYKNLPLTALLYFIFLILAIKGFLEWKKVLKTNSSK